MKELFKVNKKFFRIGILLGFILFLIVLIYSQYYLEDLKQEQGKYKLQLNEIQIQNLNQQNVPIKVKKPAVINFWATWCEPCVKEFPHFEELQKTYSDEINVYMISEENEKVLRKFKEKHNYKLNIVKSLKNFSDEYKIGSYPTTYFYDAKGNFFHKHSGAISKDELTKITAQLISNTKQ